MHSFSLAGEVILVRPTQETPAARLFEDSKEVYESRRGFIDLNVQPLLPALEINESDILELSFFPDAHYRVIVQSISRQKNGAMSISGVIEGQQIGSFVLTFDQEGFLITLQDIERALLYRSSGRPPESPGIVTEIDTTKLPPMRDLPPLIPPVTE
ncbi:MAG: hypothetical protein K9M96_10250 [Deltaproteobacteria bacterium]|nr:hypothetical protein [Deltaproteobacteria bacterium]